MGGEIPVKTKLAKASTKNVLLFSFYFLFQGGGLGGAVLVG